MPFSSATANSALPCSAISALFAVTTCLPLLSACFTTSKARIKPAHRFNDYVDILVIHHGERIGTADDICWHIFRI